VRVASHTPAMHDAATAFARHIAPLDWRNAERPVVCNVDGRGRRDPDAFKLALSAQMKQMVQWDSCMDVIAERRPDCVLEVGPGSGLSRMWAARHPHIPARSVDEFGSLEAICLWVQRHRG
jgi:[acyl-carrier-protein] S-malonyltransferase